MLVIPVVGGTNTDPYWSSVVYLDPCQGANNSPSFVDFSGRHVITGTGTVTSTAQTFSGRGISSGYHDGTGDYTTAPDSADFTPGTSFFAEMFVRFPSLPSSGNRIHLFGHAGFSTNTFGWLLGILNNSGTYQLELRYTTNGLDASVTNIAKDWAGLAVDTDYFLALGISSTAVKLYGGAASGASVPQLSTDGTLSGSIANVAATFDVGRRSGDGSNTQAATMYRIGPRLTTALRTTGNTCPVPSGMFPLNM